MAEKKQNTERKLLDSKDDILEEIEFQVLKADEIMDRDVKQGYGQQMSLPVQSVIQVSQPKEPSLHALEDRDTSLNGPDDPVNAIYLQDGIAQNEERNDFSKSKLQDIGAGTVLKTDFGKVKLPKPLSSRTDIKLRLNDGKAYVIGSDICFEAQKDTAGNWTFVPNALPSEKGQNLPALSNYENVELDEVEKLTVLDNECYNSESGKENDAKTAFRCIETKLEHNLNTTANSKTATEISPVLKTKLDSSNLKAVSYVLEDNHNTTCVSDSSLTAGSQNIKDVSHSTHIIGKEMIHPEVHRKQSIVLSDKISSESECSTECQSTGTLTSFDVKKINTGTSAVYLDESLEYDETKRDCFVLPGPQRHIPKNDMNSKLKELEFESKKCKGATDGKKKEEVDKISTDFPGFHSYTNSDDSGHISTIMSSESSTDFPGFHSCTNSDDSGHISTITSSERCPNSQVDSPGVDALQKLKEVHVSPVFATIVENARENQRTKHLFFDIDISFHEKDDKLVCVITSKHDASDTIVEDILKLQDQYGTRDFRFNEIKLLNYIPEVKQSSMVSALLRECKTQHDDLIHKVDAKNKRIHVAASTQAKADRITESELKNGLSTDEQLIIGPLKHKHYLEKFVIEVQKEYYNDIQTQTDLEGYKVRYTGLKSSVKSASEKFGPVSKSYEVEDEDKCEFIASEMQKIATGELNLLVTERHEQRGFVLAGPDYQVEKMYLMIGKWLENFSTNKVYIRDCDAMSFFHGNAGKEFTRTLATECEVIVREDSAARGDCWQKSHTFSNGHVLILSRWGQTNQEDALDVKLQVSENSADQTHVYEVKTENFCVISIPKYKGGTSKEKVQINIAVKQLLEFANKKSIIQMIVHIVEIGGWQFSKLVKQILFSVKEHLDETLKVPTTLNLLLPSIEKYKVAEKIFVKAFPDLEFDDNYFRIDASETRLQTSVLQRDLLEAEADVLVYAINPWLDLKDGVISAALLARAGSQLQEDLFQLVQERPKQRINAWEFVCTKGHNLPYCYVFHGAIEKFGGIKSIKDMQNFIYRCLMKAEELEMKSVVFPAIGTGSCGYKREDIAISIYEAVMLFEMKYPMASLSKVCILHPGDETFGVLSRTIQAKQETETKLLRAGRVLLRGRLSEVDKVMADAMVVFWKMDSFKFMRIQDDPFLLTAGQEVFKKFVQERDTGRTFTTSGGHFYPKLIIHVPFRDHEPKLEAAFQDGITKVEEAGCKSCVFYIPDNSPLLKYEEKMVKYLLRAIGNLSGQLLCVRLVMVVIQSSNKSVLDWFEKASEIFVQAGQASKYSAVTSPKPKSYHAIKISGLEQNVKRATKELEAKIAQLQFNDSKDPDVATAPPREQKISESDRGISDLSLKVASDEEEDVCCKVVSKSLLETNEWKQSETVNKELMTGLQEDCNAVKPMKGAESKRTHEKETQAINENQGQLEKREDYDIQRKHEWNHSLLLPDEYDCCYVVVENIEEKETYDTLLRKLHKSGLPVLVPELIYPFENKQKALLKCQNPEDADKLYGYTNETYRFKFKKLSPQSLQMMKVRVSHQYIVDRIESTDVEKLRRKLEEIGIVNTPESQDDLSVTVTIITLTQAQILTDVLKAFEVKKLDKTPHSGQTDKMSSKNKDGLTNDDLYGKEQIFGVNEIAWKVFKILHFDHIKKLTVKNISITFESNVLLICGYANKADILDVKKEVDNVKKLQMEEIKPANPSPKQDYSQWCSQAKNALGKECCVYDEETDSFIAFGDCYEDINKVKHQLALKQGMIKQTGRRRNRNFDATGPRDSTEIDAGSQSVPISMSGIPKSKHGSPDFDWSADAKQKEMYITGEGIKVFVYIADILKLPVDCIVNAANDILQHGGGVAKVIEKGAGWKLTQEGDKYVKNKGKIPVGMACVTTAGNLPYDCVIHAVGPRWHDFMPHTYQKVKKCESLLQNAIIHSFTLADERNLKSIALPAISSAIFAVPQEMCAVQYARAIMKYSSGSLNNAQRLQEIHFIDKNHQIVGLIQRTFQIMIQDNKQPSYDINSYVTDGRALSEPSSSFISRRKLSDQSEKASKDIPLYIETGGGCEVLAPNGSQVYLYEGDILEANKSKVSCIICADDVKGQGKGGLARTLISKAKGFPYESEKSLAFRNKLPKTGEVVLSAGHGTGFENVFHAILWGYPEKKDQKTVIQEAYENLLIEATWRQFSTVAMPLLGTGLYKSISEEQSAEAFMSSFIKFCDTEKKEGKLTIHLICKDLHSMTQVNEVIKRYLQKKEKISGLQRKQWEGNCSDTDDQEDLREAEHGTCAICLDTVSTPKSLPCGHVFCKNCIDGYHKIKKVCPTCGKVCGVIIGDQPEGKMSVTTLAIHCAGYRNCGTIKITYFFPDGTQKSEHPQPGKYYKGITRIAYLPDNDEGREILALLYIAFDRKLVFTIGRSRTTDREGVITWNDIHHKTNLTPGESFGYPDPGYLARVKDELAAKGVTVDDIQQLSSCKQIVRTVHHRH